MCDITDKLKTIVNPNDPQDQKTILLAQLVSSKFTEVKDNLTECKDLTKETHILVENLISKVNDNINTTKECPVFKEKEKYEMLTIFLKKPKIALAAIIGFLTLSFLEVKDYIFHIFNVIIGIIRQ